MIQETENLQELREGKTHLLEERHATELEDFDNDADLENHSTSTWKHRSISSVSSLSNLSTASSNSATSTSTQGGENNGSLVKPSSSSDRLSSVKSGALKV